MSAAQWTDAANRAAEANWRQLEIIAGPAAVATRTAIEAAEAARIAAHRAGNLDAAALHSIAIEEIWSGFEHHVASIRGGRA